MIKDCITFSELLLKNIFSAQNDPAIPAKRLCGAIQNGLHRLGASNCPTR